MPGRSSALFRFVLLYGALYAAFGVQSPFLPALLGARGLEPRSIALALAAGTAVRLLAGPLAGRLADRLDAPRAVLGACMLLAALAALGYLLGRGVGSLVLVCVLQSAMLAPLTPLTDALALAGAASGAAGGPLPPFHYGWVRGAGSAAFILGAILAGAAVARLGLPMVVWLNAGLLLAASLSVNGVPRLTRAPVLEIAAGIGGVGRLLRLPVFRRVILVAALILGSHALHDSFAVIRWRAAGIGPQAAGLLWAESVAAEVAVFLMIGRPLLNALRPAGAAMLAAAAGIARWAVMAQTAWLPAVAMVQPLHGITFALLHLACMRLLAEIVPDRLAATALAVYGTVGVGAATALLTLASGTLYARFGATGFWFMAAICVVALPVAWRLRAADASARGDDR